MYSFNGVDLHVFNYVKIHLDITYTELYSDLCQTSTMEFFAKIDKGWNSFARWMLGSIDQEPNR